MAIDRAALQRAHPTWNIVDAIEAPNGGIWAVGADGGVFSLNASGGTDGVVAPFFGSYTGLAAEHRQGTRSFVAIRADPLTGGYELISNQTGQNYLFKGDKPIGGDTGAKAPEPTKAIEFTDDIASLTNKLNQYGLGALVDEAWRYYKDPTGGGGDVTKVLDYLPTTEAYRNHFPGLKELADQGRAWTPAQWNDYYNDITDAAVSAGIPPTFVERGDIGKMLAGGVSKTEALGRIQAAGQSVYNADPVLIAKMREMGFSDGDLTAFYLDADKAAPLLERKNQEGLARISGAAQRTGYDPSLGVETAKGLQELGVDEAEAEAGFGKLYGSRALFDNLVGEEGEITYQEQLAATFGDDVAAAEEIERRRARRQAGFQGGGGAAGGGSGRTGLGSS